MASFEQKAHFISNNWSPGYVVSNDDKLRLYGLFKQSTLGDCNAPEPSWYQYEDKAKWQAWTNEKGTGRNLSRLKYIALADELIKKYS